jgi:hypothetical protein
MAVRRGQASVSCVWTAPGKCTPSRPKRQSQGTRSASLRNRQLTSQAFSAETCWPSRADGAVKLAESFLAGHPVSGTGGERFQVMVHLDQEVLGPDGAWTDTLEDGTRVFRGNAAEGGVRLRPRGRRSRRGGAEHRPPRPHHTARHPPRLDAARPRLRLPRLHPHAIPVRSPHRALAPRRQNQPGQLGHVVHIPPSPGARGRVDDRCRRGRCFHFPLARWQAACVGAAAGSASTTSSCGCANGPRRTTCT